MASIEEAGRVAGDPVMIRKYGSAQGRKSEGVSAHAQEHMGRGAAQAERIQYWQGLLAGSA